MTKGAPTDDASAPAPGDTGDLTSATGEPCTGARALAYFRSLGDHVDQTWTARGRQPEHLSELAADALADMPVPTGLAPETILELLASGAGLPKQRPPADPFGQPPAVVYRGENLEIQALTWMEGTTSTHQHGFDGAFRVLWGSSLHVEYAFASQEVLADGHLVAGRLQMVAPEVLWPGDVRPVRAGPDFIHALFHLERPSATLVVRNGTSNLPFPQYDYRLPGLGFDVLEQDDRLRMRFRGLHTLYRIDRGRAASVARASVGAEDLWTAFRVCDEWALTYGEGPELAALVEVLAGRAEPFGSLLPPMYAEEVRRGRLLARRGLLHDPRHRLFLALIVNLQDRGSIDRVLRELFPDREPSVLLAELVEELASPQYRGISGLALDAGELAALKAHLAGGSAEDALGVVATNWRPPSLLETLFA